MDLRRPRGRARRPLPVRPVVRCAAAGALAPVRRGLATMSRRPPLLDEDGTSARALVWLLAALAWLLALVGVSR
jgi:hypothetical protein